MKELVELYQRALHCDGFYEQLLQQTSKNEFEYNQHSSFLKGFEIENDNRIEEFQDYLPLKLKLRIDVPIWFGDIQNSEKRVLIFGSEPRDTDSLFNVLTFDNNIFAATFGADRWNEKSTVRYKPQNKYYNIFKNLIAEIDQEEKSMSLIFSDIIKYFHIEVLGLIQNYEPIEKLLESYNVDIQKLVKSCDDSLASLIYQNASKKDENIRLLEDEIKIIKPTHILCFGQKVNRTIDSLNLKSLDFKFQIKHIKHPANRRADDKTIRDVEEFIFP